MNGDAPQLSHAQQPDVVSNDAEQPLDIVVDGDAQPSLNGHSDLSPVSPATPVSNVLAPDAKIDVDFQEQESDARSEPLPAKTTQSVEQDILRDASTISQSGTSPHPDAILVDPPVDTPSTAVVDDSQDVDSTIVNGDVNGVNGANIDPDVSMADNDEQTPVTTPGVSGSFTSGTADSIGISTSHTTPNDAPEYDDEDKPPPAKRARVYSDADKASLAHSASPPPASAVTSNVNTPVPPPSSTESVAQGPSTLSVAQYRFCQSTIRSLKKLKDAAPFLRPVDPVSLNIPHYPSIIKNPMDFSTMERKLTASNPVKPDSNPQNPRYFSADEFIADVRLIMANCVTFNGPDHVITAMGKRVEEVFDKQIKNMPPAAEMKPPVVKKQSTPPHIQPPAPAPPVPAVAAAPAKKLPPARRPSTSMPVIRRSDAPEAVGRPKREIHPPPPKDLAYADAPKKPRKVKREKEGESSEQLKYCHKILVDLHKKQYFDIASPFYEPVDWVRLEIPSYPKMIKRPMDLSTIKKKLESNQYPTAQKFYDDFKLMIRNCFTFNPAGTPVNQAGQELQRLFDEKWKSLPPETMSEDEGEEEEEDTDDERARTIAMMESQIETIKGTISALKSKPAKDKKKKAKQEKAPVPSTSKAVPKPSKATSKKKGKKPVADDDVLSFDQKKDLSEAIGKLEGARLEKVVGIIHEGVPEIRDSTEEIELEIDLLPASVLTRLYNLVIRPMKPAPPKRNRPGKGTGTGGLKRKSMDENVEAEKIRQLEQRMKLFEQGPNGSAAPAARANDSEHSSDSSSDDSSGSDSE